MRNLIIILSITIIVTGCSITKKSIGKSSVVSEVADNRDIIAIIENQNLTSSSFFIQKADVQILSNGESESFIATVKYDNHGRHLISLRGKSGIEAARIFITKDTILVNDRINRQLLFGNPGYLEKKFGLPIDLLPVIFGDLISDRNETDIVSSCTDGTLNLERNLQGVNMRYLVDCKKKKIVSAARAGSIDTKIAELRFDKFINHKNGLLPSEIHIKYMDSEIFIKIVKFEAPWEGEIEFIPGIKYEQIELL